MGLLYDIYNILLKILIYLILIFVINIEKLIIFLINYTTIIIHFFCIIIIFALLTIAAPKLANFGQNGQFYFYFNIKFNVLSSSLIINQIFNNNILNQIMIVHFLIIN